MSDDKIKLTEEADGITIDECTAFIWNAIPDGVSWDILRGALGRVIARTYQCAIAEEDPVAFIARMIHCTLPDRAPVVTIIDGMIAATTAFITSYIKEGMETTAMETTSKIFQDTLRKSILMKIKSDAEHVLAEEEARK